MMMKHPTEPIQGKLYRAISNDGVVALWRHCSINCVNDWMAKFPLGVIVMHVEHIKDNGLWSVDKVVVGELVGFVINARFEPLELDEYD